MRRAAFLDRDGVINEDRGYVTRAEDFHLLPGVSEALRRLSGLGYALVVITNQSAIGRGMCRRQDVEAIHNLLREQLAADGITLDAIYFCPHTPDHGCTCRKPQPGMILTAARDLDLDLPASILIGDQPSDIEAGNAAEVGRCFLIGGDCTDLLACVRAISPIRLA